MECKIRFSLLFSLFSYLWWLEELLSAIMYHIRRGGRRGCFVSVKFTGRSGAFGFHNEIWRTVDFVLLNFIHTEREALAS